VVVEVSTDLKKAVDQVCRLKLTRAAAGQGFPLQELLMSLKAYEWARIVAVDGLVSQPLFATRGIAAGSASAIFELAALLMPAIRRINDHVPHALPCVFVDDFNIEIRHEAEGEVVKGAVAAVKWLHGEVLDKLGLVRAEDKSTISGSHDGVLAEIGELVGEKAGAKAFEVRKLGIDFSFRQGRARAAGTRGRKGVARVRGPRLPVQKTRLLKAAARAAKLRRLAKGGAPKVYASAVTSMALYGCEHSALPRHEVQKMRVAAARATGLVTPGVDADTALLAMDTDYDPGYQVCKRAIGRLAKEVWMASAREPGPRGHEDLIGLGDLRRFIDGIPEDVVDGDRYGPDKAIGRALDTVGWRMEGFVIREDGASYDMRQMAPLMVLDRLKARFQWITDTRRSTRLCAKSDIAVFDVGWDAFRAALRGSALDYRAKKLLLQMAAGAVHTEAWLAGHGFAVNDTCLLCGGKCDLLHYLESNCGYGDDVDEERAMSRLQWNAMFCKEAAPGVEEVDPEGETVCTVDGQEVPARAFRFHGQGEVYSDGSAKGIGFPQMARAAGAVCQHHQGRWYRLTVRLPRWLKPSAVAAEWWAACRGSQFMEGGSTLVLDCAAVLRGIGHQEGRGDGTDHSDKYAGMHRLAEFGRISRLVDPSPP